MDGEAKGMIDSEVHIMIARHNVITAIDGNRDDRDAELLRQEESSALERSHLSRLSACPFGKHYYRHTVLKGVVSVVVSFLDLLRSALIHGNMLCCATSGTYEWDAEEFVFHHPFEVAVEVTIDEEDIERALMIAHEDILLIGTKVLPAFHFDGE
mgnify:FL=1